MSGALSADALVPRTDLAPAALKRTVISLISDDEDVRALRPCDAS